MHEGPGATNPVAPGPSSVRTWFPLITVWVVWGTTYLGTSAMVQTIPPLLGAGSRYFVGGVALALIVAVAQGPRALRIDRRQLGATAIAGLGIIGIWGAIVPLALEHIPGGIAALIAASVPLWIVLLRVATGDSIGWITACGVVVGIAGVAAMLLPGGIAAVAGATPQSVVFWSLAMVIASLTWSFFSFRARSLDLPGDALVGTVYQLLWCGGGIVVVGLLIGERADPESFSPASISGWVWLAIASVIGYVAYTYLIQHVALSLVSTFAFVNPVVAVLLGWAILGEPFSRSVIIGLLVVVTGTALVVVGESRRRADPSTVTA